MNVYETHAGGARVRAWQRTGPCALGLRLRVCACVFFLFTSATRAQDATTPGSDAAEGGEGERDQSDAAEANREGAGEAAPAITPPTLEEPPPTPQAPGSVGGRARFQVLIDETGAVSEAAPDGITLDSLAASLDVEARRAVEISVLAIALDYVQRLRFTPARQGDEALAVRIAFEVAVPPRQLPRSDASMDSPDASVSPDAADATESDEAEGPAPAGESGGAESGEADADEDEGFGASASVDAPVRERSGSTAGDFDVDIGDLRRVPRVGAQSMLTLVPGVLLTQHANEGHALAVYLRGFDAGEGEDLEVLVDGMPINEISNAHGHGYVDPLFAIPDVVDSLRVVQGPFDPAQGDFATAGTAEYRLGVRERGVHLSLGYGRFDELRFSGVWAPAESEDGTFIALSYNQGDGFGPNRSFRNGSAIGRYEGLSGKLRYSLMAFGATGTWLSANVVRADDVSRRRVGQAEGEGGTDRCGTSRDAQFFCLYDPNQGGSTQQAGIVGRLRHGDNNRIVEATLFGRLRSLRIQENFTGFSTDPRTDGGPQRGDNQDQQYEATTIGARFRYRLARSFFNFAQRFEAGLQLRYDDALTRADRRRDSRGTPYRTDFDREVRETLVGAYARAELQFLSWLRVIGGARLD
ncbi:MAG: TonB-dependent receptor plug domain-containing protein, partial [Myxococcota bacterium]